MKHFNQGYLSITHVRKEINAVRRLIFYTSSVPNWNEFMLCNKNIYFFYFFLCIREICFTDASELFFQGRLGDCIRETWTSFGRYYQHTLHFFEVMNG